MANTLPPEPTFPRHGFSRASALLPKAYVGSARNDGPARKDTQKLWDRFKRSSQEADRNALIETYLPLVRITAERMHSKLPSHVEVDELIQAGVFGLMDAIDGFDPERGVKFEVYAKTRISGAILDDLRNQDFAPRLVRTHSHRLDRAYKDVEAETGTVPEPDQVAAKLQITMEELDRWLREINMASIVSLDRASNEYDGDGKEIRKVDTIEDGNVPAPTHAMERRELIELATRGLSKKEKLIVILYYLEELTMKEVGLVLDLSESRVCQIHHRILYRLKQHMERMRDDLMG
ncbi:MAG: FliA/WhiG family RNA polymerase sigma factor [Planctomycetes bacterium]|nr:FliA/WhiG family RNA polymerase sigma factor [Planctomycetota bacterium]MCW8136356.1 FliA/WhiG family RNA polymerase sigma factor [Planctomycetota bacterium]